MLKGFGIKAKSILLVNSIASESSVIFCSYNLGINHVRVTEA